MADCDRCGARIPLREAFSTSELIGQALAPGAYRPMRGPCTCGGVLLEDVAHTLAIIEAFVRGEKP